MKLSATKALEHLQKVQELRADDYSDDQINAALKADGIQVTVQDLDDHASSWSNFFRTMGQGLSFGFGDEAIAGLRSAFTDETYADALAQERAGVEGYRAANPGKAIAAEVAGALPMALIPGLGAARAASLGGRLGQAALRGTGEGALYGAGVSGTSETAGKDTLADDIRSASQNALMGAAGGTVMRAGTEVLGPTLRKGAARLLGTNEAQQTARDIVRDTARMDGSDVVEQRIDDVSPINRQDVRLGDLTEGLQEQTAAANFMGGPGAQVIRPQLKAREAGAGARIDDALTRAMRTQMSFKKYMAFELNDISKYQQLASPMYNDAFDNMTLLPIMDQLKKLAKDPLIASKAVNKAKLLSGLDDFDLGANATPRTWEMIRRGLGDVIGDETDSLTGKTSAVGQRAAALKREITDLMDRPEVDTAGLFKTARNTFADPAALKSAMEKGHKLFRTQDTTKLGYGLADIEQMTRGEKDAVLKGVAYSIKDLLNKDNKAPRIMRQITTGGRADILRALLPDEGAYNQFMAKLDDELMMLETSGDILRGSRTEPLRQAIQRVQKQAGGLTAMSPQGFISSLVSRLRDDGEQATRENVTRYMAEMLMTPVADAKKISSILKGNKVDRIYEAVRSVSAAMSEKVGRVTPTIAEQQFQLSPF